MEGSTIIILCANLVLTFGSFVQGETGPTEYILKELKKCSVSEDSFGTVNCMAVRVLRNLQAAEIQGRIEIVPGVILVNDKPTNLRVAKSLIETEDLPTNSSERSRKLLHLLLEAATRFISGRSLKIQIPSTTPENLARTFEEGRAKMKKMMMGPFMLGIGAKMLAVVPMVMSGLALLASKALIIGKLALVLSTILFVQVFFSGGRNVIPGGWGYNNVYGYGTYGPYGNPAYGLGTNNLGGWGGTPQYPYARSLDGVNEDKEDPKAAQDMAYSSHR